MPDAADRIRQSPPGASVCLADDLVLFGVTKARFRFGQTYALLRDDHTVLVDAVHAATRGALDAVLADAAPVAVLVLTHSDLLGQAWGPPEALADRLGAPVVIAEADRQGTAARPITFGERTAGDANDLLDSLGLAPFAVPGHTPGSVVTVARREGYVFCGDAAVGPTYGDRTGPGLSEWSHPPVAPADWPRFAEGWRVLADAEPRPTALLPLHGRPAWADPSADPSSRAASLLDAVRFGSGGDPALAAFGRGVLDPDNQMRA